MDENKTNEFIQEAAAKAHPLLLLREVANKFIAVVLVAITVMSCVFVVSKWIYAPQYEAKATFVVSVKNGATSVYSNLNAAQGAAKSLSKILCSDAMKKQIAGELGVKKIAGTIEANIVEETNILELHVTAASPREAYRIITALIDNYEPLADKVLDNVVLDALQYPTVPVYPINSESVKRPVIMSGIASAVAVIALICIITYLRDTIKTTEEVEEKLDAKLLGTIQHEVKHKTLKSKIQNKKKSILISDATTGFGFVESFKKLRTRIDYAMRKENFKTLMVSSALEDEGKSTVAANIALAMKRKYDNVLLVDADMKKSALHKIMGYQDREYATLNDVLEGKVELEEAVVENKETGLKLLFADNCGEYSTELVNSENLRELISLAKEKMDIVIIDTPPMTASLDAECIAEAVDAAVIVVRQNLTPAKVINDMIDVINDSHAELLGCVLNNYSAADFDDTFSYSSNKYGYGKYGYGKYAYSDTVREQNKHSIRNEEGAQ